MKLSVVVPAYNEEKLIGACLDSIRAALEASARPELETEVIVVDNNSTDRTASLAAAAGAIVVAEPVNQIARARNAGAARAGGDWLVFIDADSEPDADLIRDLLASIDRGNVIGGGCLVRMDGLPWYACWVPGLWNGISLVCRWAAGSFVFCRSEDFRAIGGFSEELYASEEIDFSKRLKRLGRWRGEVFTILTRHPLRTSGRKLGLYSPGEFVRFFWNFFRSPQKTVRDRSRLDVWYDGRR